MRDGVRDGFAWTLHHNGQLQRLERWVNDKRQGPVRGWHLDGRPALSGAYKDDLPDGRWQRWSSQGDQTADFHMRRGTGVFTTVYDHGGLQERGPLVNGVRNGTWFKWRFNTHLEWIGEFRSGDRDGVWQLFNRAGRPNGTIVYDRGTGLEVFWHEDGRRAAQGHVVHGRKHGMWTWWHEDGSRSLQMMFRDGRAHGDATGWHPNGTTARKETLVDGALHGAARHWSSAGDLLDEGSWQRGRPHLLRVSYRTGERLAFVSCYWAGALQWTADRADLLNSAEPDKGAMRAIAAASRRPSNVTRAQEQRLRSVALQLPCPVRSATPGHFPTQVRDAARILLKNAAPSAK